MTIPPLTELLQQSPPSNSQPQLLFTSSQLPSPLYCGAPHLPGHETHLSLMSLYPLIQGPQAGFPPCLQGSLKASVHTFAAFVSHFCTALHAQPVQLHPKSFSSCSQVIPIFLQQGRQGYVRVFAITGEMFNSNDVEVMLMTLGKLSCYSRNPFVT